MTPGLSDGPRLALLVLLSLCAMPAACREGESRACTDALFQGRENAKRGELEAARDRLKLAEEHCDARREQYIRQLRSEIAARQQELDRRAKEEAEHRARQKSLPVADFMEWVAHRREAADKTEDTVECFERGHERFGWCTTVRRVAPGLDFSTLFLKSKPGAFRFSVDVGAPVVCDDLGPHRVVRAWQATDGKTRRLHCEFTSKSLRGLSALVSVADGRSRVEVFSRPFVDLDAEFRRLLEREGR